jgi:hypothetical protein
MLAKVKFFSDRLGKLQPSQIGKVNIFSDRLENVKFFSDWLEKVKFFSDRLEKVNFFSDRLEKVKRFFGRLWKVKLFPDSPFPIDYEMFSLGRQSNVNITSDTADGKVWALHSCAGTVNSSLPGWTNENLFCDRLDNVLFFSGREMFTLLGKLDVKLFF